MHHLINPQCVDDFEMRFQPAGKMMPNRSKIGKTGLQRYLPPIADEGLTTSAILKIPPLQTCECCDIYPFTRRFRGVRTRHFPGASGRRKNGHASSLPCEFTDTVWKLLGRPFARGLKSPARLRHRRAQDGHNVSRSSRHLSRTIGQPSGSASARVQGP